MRRESGIAFGIITLVSLLSGCAFTQWNDQAFLGNNLCPPNHPGREWAFVAIEPAAFVGDLITAPVQGTMLAVAGDWSIYKRSSCVDESHHQAMITPAQ